MPRKGHRMSTTPEAWATDDPTHADLPPTEFPPDEFPDPTGEDDLL